MTEMVETDLVDSFLLFTAASYYVFGVAPKPTTKTIPKPLEKTLMLVLGTILIVNLALNTQLLWMIYGFVWTAASCASYLGYVKWNVLWRDDVSDCAQIAMWLWDLAIAICCLHKF